MGTTRRGLAVGTDDPGIIAALDDHTDRLAGIRPGAEAIVEVAAAHPDLAALQLASAGLFLYGQTTEADALAAAHLRAAHELAPTMDEREQATLAALDRWQAGAFLRAAEAYEAVVARWPTDLLAIKGLEFLYYVLGQQHLGPRFLAVMDLVGPANPDDADVLAAHAFAAELSGQTDRAADLAEAALVVQPDTPWAHHALAHVFIVRGDPPAAIERLESFLPVWARSGRVIQAHNAWHLAVALLDRLDLDRADAVAREHLWGHLPDAPGEQIDTISYLWRAEMAGATIAEDRWRDVADHVALRTHECVFPFLSAHHAYALARAGADDALAQLQATVARRTAADDDEARRVWQPIGRAVVEACAAHGRGDLATAVATFAPVIEAMPAVGGGDAQDDLFRLAHLTALTGAGRTDDARAWWASMTAFKTPSPLDAALRDRIG